MGFRSAGNTSSLTNTRASNDTSSESFVLFVSFVVFLALKNSRAVDKTVGVMSPAWEPAQPNDIFHKPLLANR